MKFFSKILLGRKSYMGYFLRIYLYLCYKVVTLLLVCEV